MNASDTIASLLGNFEDLKEILPSLLAAEYIKILGVTLWILDSSVPIFSADCVSLRAVFPKDVITTIEQVKYANVDSFARSIANKEEVARMSNIEFITTKLDDIDYIDQACTNDEFKAAKWTLLRAAVNNNRVDVIERMANVVLALDCALTHAAETGNIYMARFICEKYPDLKIKWLDLERVAMGGHVAILEYALAEKHVQPEECWHAYQKAALHHQMDVVRFFMANNVPQFFYHSGSSVYSHALANAAEGGHLDTIELLLSEGDKIGPGAIKHAIREARKAGHEDVVNYLIHYKKSRSARNQVSTSE